MLFAEGVQDDWMERGGVEGVNLRNTLLSTSLMSGQLYRYSEIVTLYLCIFQSEESEDLDIENTPIGFDTEITSFLYPQPLCLKMDL